MLVSSEDTVTHEHPDGEGATKSGAAVNADTVKEETTEGSADALKVADTGEDQTDTKEESGEIFECVSREKNY